MEHRLEEYIVKENKRMRYGYTTGTCAAAAAKAAAQGLLMGTCPDMVEMNTPKGFSLRLPIEDAGFDAEAGGFYGKAVSCAVRKDAGDDPDITDGILIYASVHKIKGGSVVVDGGRGVGRVTKPGLDQPVGNAAINRVPRRMIEEAVTEVCEACGYDGGLSVVISIPRGEELAAKTFNPKLGIVGGLSVLGTSGIVEPMSEDALVDTIKVEMNVQAAQNNQRLIVVPGNYGEDFLREQLCIDRFPIVKCSNFVGDAVDHGEAIGIKGLLFVAHIGKFIKVSAGVMNTHSKYGDGRMEAIAACAEAGGARLTSALRQQLMKCVMMDEAVRLLDEAGFKDGAMKAMMDQIQHHLLERCHGSMEIEAIVFSNQYGELGRTKGASAMLRHFRKGGNQDDN